MNLNEKVAVVTGATRGLGRELALKLKAEGAHVIACGRTEADLQSLGGESGIEDVAADVTNRDDMERLAETAVSKYGRLDLWINNAGVWLPHPLVPVSDVTVEDTRKMMDVNLYGLMNGSSAALKRMRSAGSGTIANIISTSGLEGRNGSAGYCATKFAADGYAKAMRAELKANGENVCVVNVYPGGMKTQLFNDKLPVDVETFMEPSYVADIIIQNLKYESPEEDQVIRRPGK